MSLASLKARVARLERRMAERKAHRELPAENGFDAPLPHGSFGRNPVSEAAQEGHSVTLRLSIEEVGYAGLSESLSSLAEVAQRFLEIGGRVVDLPLCLVETSQLNDGRFIAGRTDNGRLFLEPGDGLRKLVAAVLALKIDGHVIKAVDRHGWPVLSVEKGFPTVTEEGRAGNGSAPEAA